MDPIRADKIKPEPPDWLWRERVPRKMITIFAGKPDQGKGLGVTHIAAEVSRMRIKDPVTGEMRYGQVLYSAIEDSYEIMTRPRLEAAGANLKNVNLDRFQLPSEMLELADYMTVNPVDLLVIDPLNAHLNSGISRFTDSIRVVTSPLARILEASGAACIVVEHVLKNVRKNSHPLAAIGGSGSGIVAASRMAFVFGIDPKDDDRRILCAVKHNIRDKPQAVAFEMDETFIDGVGDTPFLLFEDEIDFNPMDVLVVEEGRRGRTNDKRAAASEWLAKYLFNAAKPVRVTTIYEDAKQFGIAKKTVARAATEIGVVKDPVGGGRNCTWELSDEYKGMMQGPVMPSDGVKMGEAPAPDEPLLTDEDFRNLLGNPPPEDE